MNENERGFWWRATRCSSPRAVSKTRFSHRTLLVAHHHTLQNALWHISSSPNVTLRLFRSLARLLHGFNASNIAADLAETRGVFDLTGRGLEAQVKLLFLQAEQLVTKLIIGHCIYITGLHGL